MDLLVVGMGTFRAPPLVFNLTTKINVLLIEASPGERRRTGAHSERNYPARCSFFFSLRFLFFRGSRERMILNYFSNVRH
jgi:hypothetical protein